MNKEPFLPFVDTDIDPNWKPDTPPSLDGIHEIFLDTETTGLKWWDDDLPVGISLATPDGRKWYLPFGHRGGGNLCENQVKRWALQELKGKRIVGANTKFDIHMLRSWGVDLAEMGCEASDVQHYAALLDDNRRKFSLDSLSRDFLGEGKKEIDIIRVADMHASKVAEYAIHDAFLTKRLKEVFWPMLDAEDLQRVRALEDEIIFVVCEMEKNGHPIDMDLLERWEEETEQIVGKELFKIERDTKIKVNPKSPYEMADLFKKLNIEPTEYTDTGLISTANSALEKFDHPIIKRALRAGQIADLRSKYLVPWKKHVTDGIFRFNLHQLRGDKYGTVSGRFSSSNLEGVRGSHIQQVLSLSKQKQRYGDDFVIRKLFIPASGLFLSSDAAQIEYRLFAHFAEPPKVLEAYRKDPHVSFHEIVHGLIKPLIDIEYKTAKDINFAKLYGAGVHKLALMLGLDEKTAGFFNRTYNRLFPEAAKLLTYASKLAKQRGYVKTILGRRARFNDERKLHSALNRVIQGSAADIMKRKLVELYNERKRIGTVMRSTVHDEYCGDIADEESGKMVDEILNRQSFPTNVPILWETNVGKNWAECK